MVRTASDAVQQDVAAADMFQTCVHETVVAVGHAAARSQSIAAPTAPVHANLQVRVSDLQELRVPRLVHDVPQCYQTSVLAVPVPWVASAIYPSADIAVISWYQLVALFEAQNSGQGV